MAAIPAGFNIASNDNWKVRNPTWETVSGVQSWTIDRGRNFELEKTRTGTAVVNLVDTNGDFDPTNTGALYYPFGPLFQAAIVLQNPVDSTLSTLFRGFCSRLEWTPYVTEQYANVQISLVDGLGVLAAAEMAEGTFGDGVLDGNIYFSQDTATTAVQTRINKVLDQCSWPANHSGADGVTNGTTTFTAASATFATADVGSFIQIFGKGRFQIVARASNTSITLSGSPSAATGLAWSYGLRSIFTGNVKLQKGTYAPRSQALTVIQDAADGEFPNVANFYVSKDGIATFHGRLARFDPTQPDYNITDWKVGDAAAVLGDSNYVPAAPPLVASQDDSSLYSSAIATPANIDDGDIAGQYVTSGTAVTNYGLRTWSAENLLTLGGSVNDALEETLLFADYIRDNFSSFYSTTSSRPIVRVGQITIKPRGVGTTEATKTWALMCGVDISDRVHLKTTHHGGGGFDDEFYVEGVHYHAEPWNATTLNVTLTLDLSPASYYDNNPFT